MVNMELDDKQTLRIKGDLSFATVPDCQQQAVPLFQQIVSNPIWQVDLSAITRIDSAGLALLIKWQRLASQFQKQLVFINTHPQLRALALFGGVADFLTFNNNAND
jgi:phospholipid transport system transporter-binding protein